MGLFDDQQVICPACEAAPMVRVGDIRDELASVGVAGTAERVPLVVEQVAHMHCAACGHEATVKATFDMPDTPH